MTAIHINTENLIDLVTTGTRRRTRGAAQVSRGNN